SETTVLSPPSLLAVFGRHNSLDVVTTLLREGRARRDVNKVTRSLHHTPLHRAALHGHADIALALLRAGADVDVPDT
ncbi:unnamed protein product, partial [Ectocarpus sp. 8 AP-2014]